MEAPTPNGTMTMWFAGEHLEVVPNRLLVYTEAFSDEHGNVIAAPHGTRDAHPTTTQVRVELEERGGRTRMVMTHIGVPPDSPGAAGWAMAFDKLAIHLAAAAG
jgi:uncharacterized protein YndB with AHSA1/START domain